MTALHTIVIAMNRSSRLLAAAGAAFALVAAWPASRAAPGAASSPVAAPGLPTVVLVHGAFAPDAGQTTAQLGKGYPAPPGLAFLTPDAGGWLWLSEAGMRRHFAPDLPATRSAVMAVTQGPIKASAFDEPVTAAAWKTRPSWYVLTEQDHMIPPAEQRDMARRIGAHVTALPTGHVAQEVLPDRVAAVILDAAAHVR